MIELEEDAHYQRPLLIAAGIAVVVMALLATLGVDLRRCEFEAATKSTHARSRTDDTGELNRELRLWLDAGELDAALQSALEDELIDSGIALTGDSTRGGRVTLRVDDASFYTPLYAKARVTAVMDFETAGAERAEGDTRVELSGGCYGLVSSSTFRSTLAEKLATPLAKALEGALSSSAR